MVTGKVVQIIGATLDAEFPEGKLPKIYNALKIVDAGRRVLMENTSLSC